MNSQKPNSSRLKRPALYITILIWYLAISLIISSITLVLSIIHYNNVLEFSAGFTGLLLMMGMIIALPSGLHGIISLIYNKKSGMFSSAIALIPLWIMTSLSYDLNYYSLDYYPPLPDEFINSIVSWAGFSIFLVMISVLILAYFSSYWNSSKNSMSKK